MVLGKRGDEILGPEVIFILLTAVFFGMVLVFIYSSSSGAYVFEEAYAKNIEVTLNNAKPGSTILINMEEPLDLFAKKVFDEDDFSKVADRPESLNVLAIDNDKKTITLNLKERGGYRVSYFSDYYFNASLGNDGILIIKVMENENG